MSAFVRYLIFVILFLAFETASLAADFSSTNLQVHREFSKHSLKSDTGNADLTTLTFEHVSGWKYGDVFFFTDMNWGPASSTVSESETSLQYLEFAPRFNISKLREKGSTGLFGDLYFTPQYNDSAAPFINRVWLAGVSQDLKLPGFVVAQYHLLFRFEETQDPHHQITLVWGRPFKMGPLKMTFNGFLDLWEQDESREGGDRYVFLTEPQLLLDLGFLNPVFEDRLKLGSEHEISMNLYGRNNSATDFEYSPTLFLEWIF